MNHATKLFAYAALAAALITPLSVFAQADISASVSASANVSASSTRLSDAETKAKAKADTELQNRTDALGKLLGRIGQLKKLSNDFVVSINASVQAELSQLATLKTKIEADADSATLKADMQSITKSYRIYALVLPQSHIAAASDRVQTIVGMMQTEAQKISARLAALPSASASLQATLSDYDAKVADASVQATAAVNGTKSLTPDNGDKTVFQANVTALKAARTMLQTAQQDLVAARKDLKTLVQAIKSAGVAASTSASVQ